MLNCAALDRVFMSLAHPWRRYMVEQLCDGQASISQLAEHVPLGLPVILQHLAHLPHRAPGAALARSVGHTAAPGLGPSAGRFTLAVSDRSSPHTRNHSPTVRGRRGW